MAVVLAQPAVVRVEAFLLFPGGLGLCAVLLTVDLVALALGWVVRIRTAATGLPRWLTSILRHLQQSRRTSHLIAAAEDLFLRGLVIVHNTVVRLPGMCCGV